MPRFDGPSGFNGPEWVGRGPGRTGRGWDGPGVGPPWGGGHRMRRGDIRPVLLTSLLEGPAHGYEIIRRLEQRSGGVWRPSAGSVYPTLQMLEEEGLLSSETNAGKRVYELTDSGRVAAEQAAAHGPQSPWERGGPPESTGPRELRLAAEQLQLAARQVVLAGDAAQVDQAVAILKEARQRLYQLLAER